MHEIKSHVKADILTIIFLKNRYKDFLELGKCEVHSLKHANSMVTLLNEECNCNGFNMQYKKCPSGESWCFEKYNE